MNTLLLTFIILNILNVIIQTVKSIATVKCGKTAAAIINAVAYGLYTVVTVYMMCELELWLKALIVAVANLIGVYVVKLLEEKARKDKLWKFEATFEPDNELLGIIQDTCKFAKIPYNYIDIGKYYVVNFYAKSQRESLMIKKIIDTHNGKYFVSESKL